MIFSIGHSNHAIGKFLALLKDAEVETLVDVRSRPMSRFCPQFNKAALTESLKDAGIGYVFLGQELGGKPQDKNLWSGDKPDYARMQASAGFLGGIDRLLSESDGKRVAILCAERDPKDCHRFSLIGRHLAKHTIDVQHILSDGRLEMQQDVEKRAGKTGDLFA